MVKTFYDLCQPSMFTTTFTAKLGSRFFSPVGNLLLYNRKHERNQNLRRTQTQPFPQGELWGTGLVQTHLNF